MEHPKPRFFAYRYVQWNPQHDVRDEAAGILGSVTPRGAPLLEADDLDSLTLSARAHLGSEPGDYLYLTDGENRVYKMLSNEKHHQALERASSGLWQTRVLLVFTVTALVGAALGGGLPALAAWAALSLVFILVVRVGFLNEVEAGLTFEIMLLIILLVILRVGPLLR